MKDSCSGYKPGGGKPGGEKPTAKPRFISSQTPPVMRARYLFRLKELLEENFEELSRVQTQEHGKTIDESRGETRRGIENVEVACGTPTMMMGHNLEDVASGIDEATFSEAMAAVSATATADALNPESYGLTFVPEHDRQAAVWALVSSVKEPT